MISFAQALLAHGPGRYGGIVPAAKSANYVLTASVLGLTTQNVFTFTHQPDVCRVLTVKGNAAGIAGNVVITGKDALGATLIDTIALSGTDEVNGAKAFKSVTGILLPIKTNGSGDTVSIGVANVFGLANKLSDAGLLLLKRFDNAADAGGSLAVSATVVASNLYTPAGVPNGSKSLDLYYFIT